LGSNPILADNRLLSRKTKSTTMKIEQILNLYDREQRIDVEWPGARRERTATVVRHVPTVNYESGFVLHSRLNAATADAAIRDQIDYFERLGVDFEWKLFSHDSPADLLQRLQSAGFEVEEPETIMVLPLDAVPAVLLQPVAADVRQITTTDQLADVIGVEQQVWNEDFADLSERLANDLTRTPELLRVFAAYMDGRPISSAWLYFHPGSQFASLWGGSTLPAYRKQGFYTALLATRVQAARQTAINFLTVDASPMSRPILERFGFVALTTAYACNWTSPTTKY
jgi:GNAT superfamily N-acetyltransferase